MKSDATPHKLETALRIDFEHHYGIAVSYAALLIMNKPFVTRYSREYKAPEGQSSVRIDIVT
jgi:hypothetical protein